MYPYLCGRDNLRVLARYKRLGDADVDQALEQVGLSDRGGDKVKSYSLGMKQRLGVAAALLGEPELLILDEPTNGLDPAGMADMRELVRRLAASGQTVLLSSHLLGEVQQICDRVGVISDGRLLTESTVAELRGASSLLVRAEPIAQAVRAVEAAFGDVEVRQSPSGEPRAELHVDVDAERAPDVARALVAAGVNVYEIRMSERTLEQVFFEMTSSNEPAAVAASGKESR
ncbi:MAG: ATP-binding cassette domain-containing protein, partial [Stackebrandtia sp.]